MYNMKEIIEDDQLSYCYRRIRYGLILQHFKFFTTNVSPIKNILIIIGRSFDDNIVFWDNINYENYSKIRHDK